MLLNLVDYITPVDSGVSATQWDFSYPTNNLQKEEIKRGEILLIEAFIINLFGRLILIGCKEIASWLSESEGVSEAVARVITATLEIEKSYFYVISLFGR